MVGMPLVLLLIFGYGIRLDVHNIGVELVGHDSTTIRTALGAQGRFDVRGGVVVSEAQAV